MPHNSTALKFPGPTRIIWLLVALAGVFLGSIGVSVGGNGVSGPIERAEGTFSHSNGNGTVPWYYLTIYTIGIVFLSYYLGGVFNSQLSSSDESEPAATLLRLRSQLTFLPISRYIRNHTRQLELDSRLPIPAGEPADTEGNLRMSIQTGILIDAILRGYVLPWYNRISDEKTFPDHSKQILLFVFERLKDKVKKVNRKTLAKEIIQTVHYHWKEYCAALDRTESPNDDLSEAFKYTHQYIQNREELTKHYECILCLLVKELVPPGLEYHVFCQFMSGILVKGILLYYADVMSDPKWVNTTLVTLITSGNLANETSSNPSGSNMSTALPSPSPLLENKFEIEADTDKAQIETSSGFKKNSEEDGESPEDSVEYFEKPDSLPGIPPPKASYHNFLRLDPPGSSLREKKGDSGGPVLNSIQTALSGLLSATALPLLHDGSLYQFSKGEASGTFSQHVPLLPSMQRTPEPLTSFQEININCCTGSSPSRHHSWEDTLKHKSGSGREKAAKSLDESQGSQAVARQEEFDMTYDKASESAGQENGLAKEPSPSYDDTEDFAATIAKLRLLLEQRQSQSNLMEGTQPEGPEPSEVFRSETQSHVPPSGTQAVQPVRTPVLKVRPGLNSQSSTSSILSEGSSGSSSNYSHGSLDTERLDTIEDDGEDSDPVISRFFINVTVSKTESCGDASGQFTLYCIQYEGVYIDGESDDCLPKLVLRTTTVKRSFKEFLLLQSQLEESPIWRPHLRGIKTPRKWLNLPFPNHNSGNQRRILLEKYLQQICYHSILGFCPEVRQFMAYGDDGFQIFGLPTSNSIPLHRFDKLTKTFTGVLNTLRDALPSFESDCQTNFQIAETNGDKLNSGKSKKPEHWIPEVAERNEAAYLQQNSKLENDSDSAENGNPGQSDGEQVGTTKDDSQHNGDREVAVDGKTTMDLYPMALAMTQLLCDVLWLPHRRPHAASVSAFISISGKSLETYLQESMDLFLSNEAFLGYLEWLATAVAEWSESEHTDEQQEKDEFYYTAEDLRKCFKQKIPVWVRWMWGRNQLEVTIDRLVGFFQHSQLNHDFILSVIELLFSKLNEPRNVNE